MRRPLAYVALVTSLIVAACSDTTPTTPEPVRLDGTHANTTLEDIQAQIDILLPKGFEAAVDARWSTVQNKMLAGDKAGAAQQFNRLADWIIKKTNDITPVPGSGETQTQAATRLILLMANWLLGSTTLVEGVQGADIVVQFVPAGAAANFTTPLKKAGFRLETESTAEDRIILIAKDETPFPDQCSGPLVTRRCQYPLFYQFKSFPAVRFLKPAKFAVCPTTGDRRPDESVHARMRLAHDLPAQANQGAEEDGYIHEDGIEILPKSITQASLTDCDALDVTAMGSMQRALYAVTRFAGRLLSPKNLYAYDSGPEHDGIFTSHFNAVDPLSQALDNIAIYKNYNAWFGSNKDESVLQGAPFNLTPGVGYVVRPMSELAAGIPAATELIIITSASEGNYLNQITEQRAGAANLETWIRNGGWLVIHAGDNGPYPDNLSYLIPGLTGQKDRELNCTGLTLNVANHALVRGPDAALSTSDDLTDTNIDMSAGNCYNNHGSLAGVLPGGAEVLINEQGGLQRPVYATYRLGSGQVIVTTLTLEYSPHPRQTLINHFYWAIYGPNAGPALAALMANSTAADAPVTVNSDGTPRNP